MIECESYNYLRIKGLIFKIYNKKINDSNEKVANPLVYHNFQFCAFNKIEKQLNRFVN